ncbi:Bardet-Biedl syndrome 10 protein [Thalassophryne amazonica]|uniref:Bardet-Biedl syndrome 10 protein n=1 Tax=Thalassophryne amazonica TaxID=390379 RepID=UPI0014715AF3|nr:Bardet-Biedl syndrome 10 protein [Thalassophryne amazonica]
MLPVKHLHLNHVLQTVSVLEAVVLHSFGPEGGQVLFTRDTGQLMLSRSGTRILSALRLDHPLARMVVDCVWQHTKVTGDGSKTFVILLASLLRVIHTAACQDANVSHSYNSREAAQAATARRLAQELLVFALDQLSEVIAVGVVPYGCCISWEDCSSNSPSSANSNINCLQKVLTPFFHTRLGHTYCDFMSQLTCDLLAFWKFGHGHPSSSLQFIDNNFPALHTLVSGFPVNSSRLIEGQVIHRDFATPFPQIDHQPVKAVVFSGYLQPNVLRAGDLLELEGGAQMKEEKERKARSITQYSTWAEQSLEGAIAILQRLDVSVLLCAVKQSDAALALAAHAQISVVDCVSEDELFLFTQLSGATPLSDCHLIEKEHIATLTFCRPILLGAHRYVHVAFHDCVERLLVKPSSLIICSPGEGQTGQCASAIQDAFHMLLSTWEPMPVSANTSSKTILHKNTGLVHACARAPPSQNCMLEPGCVVPVGGVFELLLHHALLQRSRTRSSSDHTDKSVPAVLKMFANAVLNVPRHIYSHSPRHFLQFQTWALSAIQNYPYPFSLTHKLQHNTTPLQSHGETECLLEDGTFSMCFCRKTDTASQLFMSDAGLESVSCKHQLLLAVLQCVISLLRVDAVICVNNALHRQSLRLSDISLEGTEDEAEE